MSKLNRKILVIGSTGFIGKVVVELLVVKYEKIYFFARETSNINPLKLLGNNISFLYGNILKNPH